MGKLANPPAPSPGAQAPASRQPCLISFPVSTLVSACCAIDFLSPGDPKLCAGRRVGPDTLRQTWLLAPLDLLQESQVLPGVVVVLANYKGIFIVLFLVSRQVIEKSYPLARVRSCYPTNHS